jgi:hypothetical protein
MIKKSSLFKKAVAILAYNNFVYFRQVLDSVLSQTINGDSINQHYDVFVYQDGLQDRHFHSLSEYEKIAQYAINKQDKKYFFRQSVNLGTAMQFDFVESSLFVDHGYEFVVLLEHDFVLGPQYLDILTKVAEKFRDDDRISAISGHSRHYRASPEEQAMHVNQYEMMAHDWGAGIFKRSWRKRVPVMKGYYDLLKGMPFEARNNLLIQMWQRKMGFMPGSTSQDTIKANVDSALGQLRITTFPNLGTYIGAQGMNWDQTLYEKKGYDKTILFSGLYDEALDLSDERFNKLLSQQRRAYLMDPAQSIQSAFLENMTSGDLKAPNNLLSFKMTSEDVIAAYKLFLNRFPENQEVLEQKIGALPISLIREFLASDEFLSRAELWHSIIGAAKIVLAKNAEQNAQGSKQ